MTFSCNLFNIHIGVYTDANHPDGFRKLTINDDNSVTIEGNDAGTGSVEWTLTGKLGAEKGSILIDFSPKGGPKDLLGTFDGSGIVFPDGNRWPQVDEATATYKIFDPHFHVRLN